MNNRQKMIQAILNTIDDWDLETLIDYAKAQVRNDLDDLSERELIEEYNLHFDEE